MDKEQVRKTVRLGYAKIARESCSCGSGGSSCCGGDAAASSFFSEAGYSAEELAGVPEGAIVGLACGNPLSFAKPKGGETVLDLGSGTGLDCFISAKAVGAAGKVIGVDMTPEMIERARRSAESSGYENVEFRLGEIENLPAADESIDIIISNCVINLSPDKGKVFREAFRVLKPGGRLVVSDIVLLGELPAGVRESEEALVGCVANAEMKERYLELIGEAGFRDVAVLQEKPYSLNGDAGKAPVASVIVRGEKSLNQADVTRKGAKR